MNKLLKYVITALFALFLLSLQNLLYSQSMDYKEALNDIGDNYLPDYPDPVIKVFEQYIYDVFKSTQGLKYNKESQNLWDVNMDFCRSVLGQRLTSENYINFIVRQETLQISNLTL